MLRPGLLSSLERREREVCVRRQREDHGVARRANAILKSFRETIPNQWKSSQSQESDTFRIET